MLGSIRIDERFGNRYYEAPIRTGGARDGAVPVVGPVESGDHRLWYAVC